MLIRVRAEARNVHGRYVVGRKDSRLLICQISGKSVTNYFNLYLPPCVFCVIPMQAAGQRPDISRQYYIDKITRKLNPMLYCWLANFRLVTSFNTT